MRIRAWCGLVAVCLAGPAAALSRTMVFATSAGPTGDVRLGSGVSAALTVTATISGEVPAWKDASCRITVEATVALAPHGSAYSWEDSGTVTHAANGEPCTVDASKQAAASVSGTANATGQYTWSIEGWAYAADWVEGDGTVGDYWQPMQPANPITGQYRVIDDPFPMDPPDPPGPGAPGVLDPDETIS